jgi:translation initiation factor 2 beta subunit (eIF-2beta)/eIF-5
MKDNETIKEIREIRKRISARFDHDPKRLVDYYKKKQMEKRDYDKPPLQKP